MSESPSSENSGRRDIATGKDGRSRGLTPPLAPSTSDSLHDRDHDPILDHGHCWTCYQQLAAAWLKLMPFPLDDMPAIIRRLREVAGE